MKKFLLLCSVTAWGVNASAQLPTTVTPSNNCTVFRTFNNSDEGFSSPSIYSDANDVSFFWNAGTGSEVENSGLSVRNGSLISPVYVQSEPGVAVIGFKYTAPVGTQYRIRIISAQSAPPLEILATTANGPVYTPLPSTSGNICLMLIDGDLTVGRQIRFEFTFRNILPGNVTFDDLAISVAGGPLPVTFEGFVARKDDDGAVKLLWNVGDEINVKGYYVESSSNGVDFTTAGYVTATGKSIYSIDYKDKVLQTMFFRVKNIDFDGRSKYTPIIKVYAKEQSGASIQLYPVPATGLVTVQHNKSSAKAVITLYTPEGRLMQTVPAVANTLQTQVNITWLVKGVYILKYDDGKGDIQSMKLIRN